MIRAGLAGKTIAEAPPAEIDDIRIATDANSNFFRAAMLEVLKGDKVILTMPGVPSPEAFRQGALNARDAWVPGRSKARPFISAGNFKGSIRARSHRENRCIKLCGFRHDDPLSLHRRSETVQQPERPLSLGVISLGTQGFTLTR